MTTIQLVIAVAGFISIIAGFIGGAWINQRGLEKQMEAFRNEIRAEFATVRAEIATVNNRVGDVQARLERVERQIDTLFASFKPIPPGRGD